VACTPKSVAGIERLTRRIDAAAGTVAGDACRVALFRVYFECYQATQQQLRDGIAAVGGDRRKERVLERLRSRVGWQAVESEDGLHVTGKGDRLVRHVGRRLLPESACDTESNGHAAGAGSAVTLSRPGAAGAAGAASGRWEC
jgi:hypothetical protein